MKGRLKGKVLADHFERGRAPLLLQTELASSTNKSKNILKVGIANRLAIHDNKIELTPFLYINHYL